MKEIIDLRFIIQDETTKIVDVREPHEFSRGSAQRAINIPLGSIPARLEEFRQMSGPILLYCQSGSRSGQATVFLKAQGFKEVYNGGSLGQIRILQLTP